MRPGLPATTPAMIEIRPTRSFIFALPVRIAATEDEVMMRLTTKPLLAST